MARRTIHRHEGLTDFMSRKFFCAVLLAVAGLMAGCASHKTAKPGMGVSGGHAKQAGGAVASTILEEMDGGLISGSIGTGLSRRDRRSALEAEYRALEYTPSGQPVTWQNPGSKYRGQVVAGQPYQVGSQNCRQYTETVFTADASQTARGAACRNPDGSWTPLD
jgi:surface antigen